MHGGTDGACGALAGVGTQLGALADGGQLLQVFAVRGGEPQCLGQRGEDLDGGSGVAALFEADEVLHADPGQCGQLGAAQARCLASGTGGKADVGGSDGFPAAAEKSPSSLCITPSSLPRQLRGTGVPARTTRDIAHHRGASAAAARNPDAWLAQLSKRMPRIDSVPQADPYLALLDRALADRDLSSAEIRELGLVSNELGLTNRQLLKLHREYVRGLCQVAYADGEIGRDEHADLVRVTGLLRLTPADLDAATDNARSRRFPATELPTAGSLIAFTGDHPGYSRNLLVGMAERHGLTVHDPVTRKVALLVAATSSQSTNARKARDYAIPIMPVGPSRSWSGWSGDAVTLGRGAGGRSSKGRSAIPPGIPERQPARLIAADGLLRFGSVHRHRTPGRLERGRFSLSPGEAVANRLATGPRLPRRCLICRLLRLRLVAWRPEDAELPSDQGERFRLNLPDALASPAKALADGVQGLGLAGLESEATPEDE